MSSMNTDTQVKEKTAKEMEVKYDGEVVNIQEIPIQTETSYKGILESTRTDFKFKAEREILDEIAEEIAENNIDLC